MLVGQYKYYCNVVMRLTLVVIHIFGESKLLFEIKQTHSESWFIIHSIFHVIFFLLFLVLIITSVKIM